MNIQEIKNRVKKVPKKDLSLGLVCCAVAVVTAIVYIVSFF